MLLSHISKDTTPDLRATIVDTTGSFPLAMLAKVLESRIIASRASPDPVDRNTKTDIDGDVQRCLEMVGISRVFDLEGLWEVLGEVGRASDDFERERDSPPEPKEVEIANSEDEDEDESPISTANQNQDQAREDEDEGVEIIIIDSLTHIINELFSRKEKSDGLYPSFPNTTTRFQLTK